MLSLKTRFIHQGKRLVSTQVSSKKLDGRVAIVTAGTCGIGLAISKRLAEDGAHVVVSSRKEENVNRAVAELRDLGMKVSGIPCHVSNAEERKNLLRSTAEQCGGIDILVQNAGVNPHHGNILETPESALDKVYDVHIKSNFRFVQEVVPYMEKRDNQGSIVLTSTIAAFRSDLLPAAYCVTKASIFSMVKAFMPELVKRNVRINCLTLGMFDTPFFNHAVKNDEIRDFFLSNCSMKRYGRPEEAAGIASYLCSDESSYVTGENFKIAGGVYAAI